MLETAQGTAPSFLALSGPPQVRSTDVSRANRVRRRVAGVAMTAAILAALVAVPSAAASTTAPAPDGWRAVPLTTTVIDKPWYSTERFYLALVNCTRTGGWVLWNGTCRAYGSGRYSAYVRPITYSYGMSDKVSRPYAKLLATRGICSHYAGGDPGYRLRRGATPAGLGRERGLPRWVFHPKAAVLASHLVFQSEKSSNGGHWKNIKNARYRTLGIGIWRSGSRTRLVTDFYG